jgi:Uncharacterized protein conserved in bacteria (DUF2330)
LTRPVVRANTEQMNALKLGPLLAMLGIAAQFEASPVLACGGGGVTSAGGVVMDAQRIVMSTRASGKTSVVVQITVPETNADYAVLVPVPSEPVLSETPVSSEELQALDELTTPVILVGRSNQDGSGCGCGSIKSDAAGAPKGVIASDVVEIGPLSAVSLTGDDANAVQGWLSDNGFQLPATEVGLLDDYVGAGRYLIAAKRSDRAATGAPSSIGLHYELEGDHRQLSLAFARMGAAPEVRFTLFLAAPNVLAPAEPFVTLSLDDLEATTLRSGDYTAAVRDSVAKHDGKAFVLESVTEHVDVQVVAPTLAALMDASSVVTRATTVVSRDDLTLDAHFTREYDGHVPDQRQVEATPLAPGHTEFAFAAGVLLCLGLRRRLV